MVSNARQRIENNLRARKTCNASQDRYKFTVNMNSSRAIIHDSDRKQKKDDVMSMHWHATVSQVHAAGGQ